MNLTFMHQIQDFPTRSLARPSYIRNPTCVGLHTKFNFTFVPSLSRPSPPGYIWTIFQKKTSKKNEEATIPWADLPQEILGLILGKLLSAVEVIRFRAVCKNWDIPKDGMIKNEDYRNLPWLCNFSWAENQPDRLECNIYDPYSHEMSKTWTTVVSYEIHKITWTTFVKTGSCNNDNKGKVFVYGSKQGLLIAAYFDNNIEKWSPFLYNPCTNDLISLYWMDHKPCFATLSSGNPTSSGFRFSIFFRDEVHHPCGNYIHRYSVNYIRRYEEEKAMMLKYGEIWFLDCEPEECHGMQYVNEQLFCLFDNGVMKRLGFKIGSWTSIDLGEGSCKLATDGDLLWLAKGDGDLLVAVRKDFGGNCSTFCFDWSNMSWVERDLPENSAIFIRGDVATFVRPFAGNKDCNVYFFSELVCEKEEMSTIV